MRTILETPNVPCAAPEGVFDAFAWCESRYLEWRAPEGWPQPTPLTAENPPRMLFVMKRDLPFLPRELAYLHAPGLGLTDEWALAPYGIDDATDGFYEHRVSPGDALWLAADSIAGLFWGLHDWAHFHSHGSFEQRAWTELQCDATALAWLWRNRRVVGLPVDAWDQIRREVIAIGAGRFAEEGLACPEGALDAAALVAWVAS